MTEVNSSAVTVAVQALRGEVERRFGWVPNESLRELFIVGLNAYNAYTPEQSTQDDSDARPVDLETGLPVSENSEASQE